MTSRTISNTTRPCAVCGSSRADRRLGMDDDVVRCMWSDACRKRQARRNQVATWTALEPMTAIRVEVTAKHITAAGPWDIDNLEPVPGHKDPVELALIAATGRDSIIDADGPTGSIATIGQGQTTIVLNLPPAITTFCDTYYRGELVEPFTFDIEIEDWLVALIARAATVGEQAEAVLAGEAAR